ncbi:hypothetical protein Salat_2783300 [Sesamum alatum]|uniref:Uncharacterized protein n=1 Tax=Sesamum alatum TaxID=300844 RepID=A0AAE2C9H6_9LAMI|nr:hypothetical protein Salat_2783300 [Sesamum alatum]
MLMGYNFEIFYKPGKDNVVVDSLSRVLPLGDPTFAAVSSPVLIFLDQLHSFFTSHPAGQKLLSTARNSSNSPKSLRERSNLLHVGDHLFIPPQSGLIPQLIIELYSSLLDGHYGLKPTMAHFAATFI